MKQIHQVAWKFGTQNLVTTCTLTLKQNLEHFSKYILSKLYYIILKLWKSGIQHFKQCVNWSWNEEVKTIWDNCAKLKDHFEMISKFNLWIWNPIRNYPNFKFTHYHIDISPSLLRELHLGHFIHPKWVPRD